MFLLTFFVICGTVRAQISTETIFPETTQAYVAVTNTKQMQKQWNKTIYGEMISRPDFDAFRKALQEYTSKNWTSRFGMKLSDVINLASGEVGIGLIAAPGQQPGYVMIMDCAGNEEAVNEFLASVVRDTTATRNGEAGRERFVINNQPVDATVLTLPADSKNSKIRKVFYVQFPNMLITSDQRQLVEVILQRLAGQTQTCLGTVEAYQKTIQRSVSDRQSKDPALIKFFVRPLEAGEAARSMQNLSEEERAKPSTFSILAKQGYNGIKGIGGVCDLAQEGQEVVWRAMAYVPEPPELALKMLAFENRKEFAQPKWITTRVNGSSLVYIHTNELFANFGTLFDEFLETEGAWNKILVELESDENGPKINVEKDLIAWLENDLSLANIYKKPMNDDAARFVLSIPIKEGGADQVQQVLHKMFDTDPEFQKEPFANDIIWIYTPKEKADKNQARSGSARVPGRSVRRPRSSENDNVAASGSAKGAFGIAYNCLFISSDASILKQTITEAGNASVPSLMSTAEAQNILAQIVKDTEMTGRFLQKINLNVDGAEENYNLYREGKLPQSQTFIGRFLKTLTGDQEPDPAKKFDGSTLPPFDSIRNDIAPSGAWGRVESNGWFFKGFTTRKQK